MVSFCILEESHWSERASRSIGRVAFAPRPARLESQQDQGTPVHTDGTQLTTPCYKATNEIGAFHNTRRQHEIATLEILSSGGGRGRRTLWAVGRRHDLSHDELSDAVRHVTPVGSTCYRLSPPRLASVARRLRCGMLRPTAGHCLGSWDRAAAMLALHSVANRSRASQCRGHFGHCNCEAPRDLNFGVNGYGSPPNSAST